MGGQFQIDKISDFRVVWIFRDSEIRNPAHLK